MDTMKEKIYVNVKVMSHSWAS